MPLYAVSFTEFEPIARFDLPPEPWTDVRVEESTSEDGPWTGIETIALSPVDSDPAAPQSRNLTTDQATIAVGGWYRLVVIDANSVESISAPVQRNAEDADIRVMVPRVRRAVEGVRAVSDPLSDDEIKDLVADAYAQVILYTGGSFGTMTVTDREDGIPTEYAMDPILTLPEQTLVAAQAALNHYFHLFQGSAGKISERIADEAQEWEWSRSAQLLTSQFQLLVAERDKALEAVEEDERHVLDGYSSFLAVRDAYTAALVEPWVCGHLASGQEDYRFGTYG